MRSKGKRYDPFEAEPDDETHLGVTILKTPPSGWITVLTVKIIVLRSNCKEENQHEKVRVLAGLILCFAMIFAMVGCGEQKNPEKEENILCGIMNWQEPNDLDIFPTPALGEWKQYSSLTSMVLDLNAGNVEYLLVPASVASYLKAQDDSLTIALAAPVFPQRYAWRSVRRIRSFISFCRMVFRRSGRMERWMI